MTDTSGSASQSNEPRVNGFAVSPSLGPLPAIFVPIRVATPDTQGAPNDPTAAPAGETVTNPTAPIIERIRGWARRAQKESGR
jgi:hypothetical protein